MKPQLPYDIRLIFPPEVVHVIMTYVPHLPPKSPQQQPLTNPESAKEAIQKVQRSPQMRGAAAEALRDLEWLSIDEDWTPPKGRRKLSS